MNATFIKQVASVKFARFLVVGGGCTLANFLFIWFATDRLHLHYLSSLTVAFMTINAAGYLLNKYFTFGRNDTALLTELVRYYKVMAGSVVLALLAMFVLVDVVGLHYLLANLILTILLTLRNFISHRDRTFR